MRGPGFYKAEGLMLHRAPTKVEHKDVVLLASSSEDRAKVWDGWRWFDSEEEARVHYGLPIEEEGP